MSDITIDGRTYDLESLTAEAKGQVGSLQFVDAEIARTQALLAALQTARNAYANALNAELAKINICADETVMLNQ